MKYREMQRGRLGTGTMYVIIIMLVLSGFAFLLTGENFPQLDNSTVGSQVEIVTVTPEQAKGRLQLYTFSGVTVTPPTVVAAVGGCKNSQFNTRPEILLATDPASGETTNGKIRVWVTSERAPKIASNEKVDEITGQIITPGDRSAKDTTSLGRGLFFWEPTLYVVPAAGNPPSGQFCDGTKANCIAYFPNVIKGDYNSNPASSTELQKGSPVDADWTNFQRGNILGYMAEYIWDPATFGLPQGNYWAQFVVHDGESGLAMDCITIQL